MPLLDQAGDDEWTTSLFECFADVPGCLDSVLCFPCQIGRQCAALGGASNTQDFRMCVMAAVLGCGGPCFVFSIRRSIRQRFGIAGSDVADFCTAFVCASCAHCLNQRELTNRGFWPGGSLFATAPPGGMG